MALFRFSFRVIRWKAEQGNFQEVNEMQANQLTIKSYPSTGPMNVSIMPANVKQTVQSWLNRLIGCWHLEMSRPFSSEGQAYRVCVNCGAHRSFNLKNWEMKGSFYYDQPSTKQLSAFKEMAALRRVAA